MVIGHRAYDIATQPEITTSASKIRCLSRGQQRYAYRHTVDSIATVYERLRHYSGLSTQGASRARLSGYLPPSAWVGVDMNDPLAQPNIPRITGWETVRRALENEHRWVHVQ